MKRILLTKDKVALVDDDVYEWLAQYNWSAQHNSGASYYARRVLRGLRCKTGPTVVYLQRLIAGVPQSYEVRFRDGNALNCTRSNLHIVDAARHTIHWTAGVGKSEFLGVMWDEARGIWRTNLASMPIGFWETECDAARAYNVKAVEVYGDKAAVNKIPFMTSTEYMHWPSDDDRAAMRIRKYRGVKQVSPNSFSARISVNGVTTETFHATDVEAKDAFNKEALKHGLPERINE